MGFYSLLLCLGVVLPSALGHSWLTCTDYLESNGHYFDHKLCRAYPRHANHYAPNGGLFGRDTGYNYNPSEAKACRTSREDSSYDVNHKMAVYYPGQTVVLTHPTKNHVADVGCTNKYIPDSGNKLYRSEANVKGDTSLSQYFNNQVWDWGVAPVGYSISDARTQTYPKPGFQNAPKFCENPDKALGTYTWTVPKDLTPGRYSFMWAWWFNSKTLGDLYTGCFEADVVANKAARDQKLKLRGQSTGLVVDVNKGGVVVTSVPTTSGPNKPVTTNAPNKPVTTQKPGPLVNGAWGSFGAWMQCSKSCGGGVERRVRHCNNPAPANGGSPCTGSDEETRSCNIAPCPATPKGQGPTVKFTSSWGQGANGEIAVPQPRGKSDMTFVMQLPCTVNSVQVWHAEDITSPSQRSQGLLVMKQSGWMLDKDTVGFTLHFGGCRVAANQITVTVQ